MLVSRFHEICKYKGFAFTYTDNITLITSAVCSYDPFELPENVIFRSKRSVYLPGLRSVPATTIFENEGDVTLHPDVLIPENFKGIKNIGNFYPENFSLKKPLINLTYSSDFQSFLNENHTSYGGVYNKCVQDLFIINNRLIQPEHLQVSLIDFNEDKDMISFVPTRTLYKNYLKSPKKYNNIKSYISSESRNILASNAKITIRVGRFLKKMFPTITDTEVEEFVNLYKAYRNFDDYEMKIVTGTDIVQYYNVHNQDAKAGSGLSGSCMNHSNPTDLKAKQIEFYTKISKCGLLILKKKDSEKIRGRAFIWETKCGKKYVDYIYVSKNSERHMYKKYISDNNCLSNINGDAHRHLVIEADEEASKLTYIPSYLDTFKYHPTEHLIKGDK